MIADNYILFRHPSIQQSLQDYITDNNPDELHLKNYLNNLIKYKLLGIKYEQNKIILECNYKNENRYNELKALYKNNPDIIYLKIVFCKINLNCMKLISQFTKLKELILNINLKTKSGFYIKKLNELTKLNIYGNRHLKFIDYKNITSMKTITHLELEYNKLPLTNNGKIYELIGNMKQLRVLNLANITGFYFEDDEDEAEEDEAEDHNNILFDSYFTKTIKHLPKLESLNLSSNFLNGNCLNNLKTKLLSNLLLSNNVIDNEGIINITKIESLKELDLSGNQFGRKNTNIEPLFKMLKLKNLNLSHNDLLKNLNLRYSLLRSSLYELNLEFNKFDNKGVREISKITSLRVLNLSYNTLGERDINIEPLLNMTGLKKLILRGNYLRTLNLSDNTLRGSLFELNLSRNKINSVGVEEITRINSLRKLDLSRNDFLLRRDINLQPLFNMTELKELDLSHNKLRNEHIIGIGTLINTKINLDGNNLN